MAIVPLDRNPTITDTVEFRLETPDANGCLSSPYRVDKIVIYYVERDFVSNKFLEYKAYTPEKSKLDAALAAEAEACANPTTSNIDNARRLRLIADSDTIESTFYFNEARPLASFGTAEFPAWFDRYAIIAITGESNYAVVTSVNHGLSDGDNIKISGSNSIPDIDGDHVVTVVDSNTFTVPVDLTGGSAGTTGRWLLYNDITSVSLTNPTVITSAAHGLSTGDHVVIYSSEISITDNLIPPNTTAISIDGRYPVNVVDDDNFYINLNLYQVDKTLTGVTGYWYLDEDADKNIIQPVVEKNQTLAGVYRFLWEPSGAREGDYFICWTWTSVPAGEQRSSHLKFFLGGNTQVTTSIPTHFTDPKKYSTLLELYTPEMFKLYIANQDMTPSVLNRFNESVAMGFTTLEDLANQIVDLQNANSIHESLLPYLSNYFNLKLKTNDPTRWRSQIANAIPTYKKKGTKAGLISALNTAGISLVGLKQLWQVISKSTWQEAFQYDGENSVFTLEKVIVEPVDTSNFALSIRKAGSITSIAETLNENTTTITSANHRLQTGDTIVISGTDSYPLVDGTWTVTVVDNDNFKIAVDFTVGTVAGTKGSWLATEYTSLSPYGSYVVFDTVDGVTTMTWDSITELNSNDWIKVLYQYASVPNQGYENYIRTLPLIDTRDEANQTYPKKNWNVRGIQEDDPLFSVLIPSRHPYVEPLFYGKVRTEFPYSENIYNMEEYNGSIRNSKNPCDIDKDFMDPCKSCISSSFVVDLEVEDLSDDRISEAHEVFMEYSPFDAMPHTLNITGGFQEFVPSPLENIEVNILFGLSEFVVAGEGQRFFNRCMRYSNLSNLNNSQCLFRDALADRTAVVSGVSGTAYNDDIVLYCPSLNLDQLGVQANLSTLKVVDGPYADEYSILGVSGKAAILDVSSLAGPLDIDCVSPFNSSGILDTPCALPFTIYTNLPQTPVCDVERDNLVVFDDDSKNWSDLGVKTEFDVAQGTTPTSYTLSIPAYGTYIIKDIDNSGQLVLVYDSSLPNVNTTGITYTVLDGASQPVATGTAGYLNVTARGRVTVSTPEALPISSLIISGNHYQTISGTDYLINGLVPGTNDQFYLKDYAGPEINTINLLIRRLLTANQVGYLSYRGLKLQLSGDYETILGIQNGDNPVATPVLNNHFIENFIVEVNSEYYWIIAINYDSGSGNTTITLSGLSQYWKTLDFSGTAATVNFYRFDMTEDVTVIGPQWGDDSHTFATLSRSGSPVVEGNVTSAARYKKSPLAYETTIPAQGFLQINENQTSILVNKLNVSGQNQSSYISSFVSGGYICLLDSNDNIVCNFALIASPIDNTTYYQLAVSFYSGSQPKNNVEYGLAYRSTPIEDETLVSLAQNGNQLVENVKQNEAVSFKIEYANGSVEEGEL